jgi:hypothetical protein
MSEKDHRYNYVRSIWMAGDLTSFTEIFNIVPRSIVASDLRLNYERFTKKILKPELLTFRDIKNLSRLTGIDLKTLAGLVIGAIEGEKTTKDK